MVKYVAALDIGTTGLRMLVGKVTDSGSTHIIAKTAVPCKGVRKYQIEDTNELVKNIYADVVYIDPPYNSRQYCDAYHLIENIARWEKPEVYGVARKMDRSALKSKYCTRSAPKVFEDLIKNLNAKYIVVSYNNMANKGNDRSNARISDSQILDILKSKGSVKTFSEQFKAFTTGKSERLDNEERFIA